MLEKVTDLEINREKPFENDILNRVYIAENLTNFIKTLHQPFTMSIVSPWGTGKTTFIKMWKLYLENENFNCIYFNAWENDLSNDPLISFIAEFENQINKPDKNIKSTINTIKRKASIISKSAAPAIIRLITAGVINDEILKELNIGSNHEKDIEKDISKIINNYISNKFKEHKSTKDAIQQIKINLNRLSNDLTKDKKNKPLIFFIDELDRCKPIFSIELLEKIKHVFSVEDVLFVLSIDKEQLLETIRSVYGSGIKADGYLRRFIDIEYELPEPNRQNYSKFLFNKFDFSNLFMQRRTEYEEEEFLKTFNLLSDVFGFSLREQEQIFTQINLCLRISIEKNKGLEVAYLAFLICLKEKEPTWFKGFNSTKIQSGKLIAQLKQNYNLSDFLENNDLGKSIITILELAFLNNDGYKKLRQKIRERKKEGLSQDELDSIAAKLNNLEHFRDNELHKRTLEFLSFAEKMN